MSSHGFFDRELVLKLAQDRCEIERKTLAELEDKLIKFEKDTRLAHSLLSWWGKMWDDPNGTINDYYSWVYYDKIKWPNIWNRHALGLIAMSKKAEGDTVALSPDDAKFLRLDL